MFHLDIPMNDSIVLKILQIVENLRLKTLEFGIQG